MKKIILILLAVVTMLGASAFNGYRDMYLHLTDGTVHRFELNNETTLKYTPTQFIIVNQGVVYTYERQEVQAVKFEADMSSLPSVVSPVETAMCKVQGRELLITSEYDDADLYIYAVDGKLVKMEHVTSDTLSVSLSDLNTGVYIVTIGEKSEKILVK